MCYVTDLLYQPDAVVHSKLAIMMDAPLTGGPLVVPGWAGVCGGVCSHKHGGSVAAASILLCKCHLVADLLMIAWQGIVSS